MPVFFSREEGRRGARRTLASFYREVAMPSSYRALGRRAARFTLCSSVSGSTPRLVSRSNPPVGDEYARRCDREMYFSVDVSRSRLPRYGKYVFLAVARRHRPSLYREVGRSRARSTTICLSWSNVCVSVAREVAPRHERSILTLFVRDVPTIFLARSRPPRSE